MYLMGGTNPFSIEWVGGKVVHPPFETKRRIGPADISF